MPKPERRSLTDLKRNLPDLAAGRVPSPEIERTVLGHADGDVQQTVQHDVQPVVSTAEPLEVHAAQDQTKLPQPPSAPSTAVPFDPGLALQPKNRKVLDMVTFRIPRDLNEHLDAVAKRYNFSKTDLLVAGLRLILDRYPIAEANR